MWLVTADGSVNCMSDPGEQEVSVEHLHYCEVMTALSVLHAGTCTCISLMYSNFVIFPQKGPLL